MQLPLSTYRVQLHKDFTFKDLRNILDYLEQLGVHAIYAAPIFSATPGSMHGYDVTNPHMINPEIGTLEELREISQILKQKKMLWIQDIVPNHMAFSNYNLRLMDLLERGKASPYYNYFDINWNHPDPLLNGKLMVPFLGKEVEDCLNDREIELALTDGGLMLKYFDSAYPLSVHTYSFFTSLISETGERDVSSKFNEYAAKLREGATLDVWAEFKASWHRSLVGEHKTSIDSLIARVNADKSLLLQILDIQFYRLTYWKKTEGLINYRRFFTVNSLICLRMEADEVFQEYHKFIHELYETGVIQGIRIDHIDGLNDPSHYLRKLRKLFGNDCYIIAEKILEAKEEMPEHWPLEGTSGYEFLSYVNQLFTDRKATRQLAEFYHSLLPGMPSYEEVVLLNKRLILNSHMAGELENLVTYFFELNLQGTFKRDDIKEGLSLLMLSLPVYRIYPDDLPLKGINLQLMNEAFEAAEKLNPLRNSELKYLQSLCLAENLTGIQSESVILFLRRLMQFTGPLTAKGVEDTTFYIYNPLISHVEVGDAPSTLGISIQEFHMRMIKRQQATPHSLNATATHDTKRGEDARVRLNAISELPEEWISKVTQWITVNKSLKKTLNTRPAPILNDEYFIYQSILGGFPESLAVTAEWVERLKQYMVKVVREAKVMSNWESPNEEYETACQEFIDSILQEDSAFLQSFLPFLKELLPVANIYSVAQAVIKMTAPGIPDIYQGCELYDLSYVDPDNRRPVDYAKRKSFQEVLQGGQETLQEFLNARENEGARKFFATSKCLALRKEIAKVFNHGVYLPLTLTGQGGLAFSFARYHEEDWCIVVIPLGVGRKNNLNATDLRDIFISLPANSPREWRNVFTNEPVVVEQDQIALPEVLRNFPVAVLSNK